MMKSYEFKSRNGTVIACAWCMDEQHVTATPVKISHGICQRHTAEMLMRVGLEVDRSGEVCRVTAQKEQEVVCGS